MIWKSLNQFTIFIILLFLLVWSFEKSLASQNVELEELYENGKFKEAYLFSKEPANKGDAVASRILGLTYLDGLVIQKDIKKSIFWLTKSADLNDVESLNKLSDIYFLGTEVGLNHKLAKEYSERAFKLGSKKAACRLSDMATKGITNSLDENKALEILKKGVNNPICLNGLAEYLYSAKSTNEDIEKAIKIYEKSANLGSVYAMNKLVHLYKGKKRAISRNIIESKYWSIKASFEEMKLSVKLFNNGYLNEAFEITEKMAVEGNAVAQAALWGFYKELGGEDPEIKKKFLLWLFEAADNDYYLAQGELAWMYFRGEYLKIDINKSNSWAKKAIPMLELFASRNHLGEQYNLASLYYYGIGVDKNLDDAMFWIKKAKLGGHPKAGELYMKILEELKIEK